MRITLPEYCISVLSTRFNDATFAENVQFRARARFDGCVYGTPREITERIPLDERALVLEMNNDTNTIMGIGVILNRPRYKRFRVYSEGFYNALHYRGERRIDRAELLGIPCMRGVLEKLERLCFKGKDHIKRGQGITALPEVKYRRTMTPYDTFVLLSACGEAERLRPPVVCVRIPRGRIKGLAPASATHNGAGVPYCA
jgi:hypothetical protein